MPASFYWECLKCIPLNERMSVIWGTAASSDARFLPCRCFGRPLCLLGACLCDFLSFVIAVSSLSAAVTLLLSAFCFFVFLFGETQRPGPWCFTQGFSFWKRIYFSGYRGCLELVRSENSSHQTRPRKLSCTLEMISSGRGSTLNRGPAGA